MNITFKHRLLFSFALFIVGSIIGAVIDTAYCFILEGADHTCKSFFGVLTGVSIPFLPVYGLGAVLIYLIRHFTKNQTMYARALLYGFALTLLEFIAGFFSFAVLRVRLWDYSDHLFDIFGYIDILHTVYWIGLALLLEFSIDIISHRFHVPRN